jgi:hypothetical protein
MDWDLDNCGGCGKACENPNNWCYEGVCKTCDEEAGYGLCPLYESDGEFCADFNSDPSNCGDCGKPCSSNACLAGECCPNGAMVCGDGCVDIFDDPNNCGYCGFNCTQEIGPGAMCTDYYCYLGGIVVSYEG